MKITSPQEGAQVQANLNLQATVTDDIGVTRVDVFLDNKMITSKGAAPWAFPVVLPAGKHTLRVEGRDASGKMGSAAVTVHVDGGSAPPPSGTPPPGASPATPPATPAPGKGYGEVCAAARECDTNICANDLTLGKQYCTRICDPGSPCPVGSDCFASTSGQSVCAPLTPDGVGTGPQLQPRPTEGMSCAVGRGGSPALSPLLLLLLLWCRRR